MTPIEWVGIGLLVVGAVLLGAGIFRAKIGKTKIAPIVAIPVGLMLIVVAIWGTGLAVYLETGEVVDYEPTVVCADFEISPVVTTGNGQLNSAEDRVTVGFYANTTGHTIAENDNTTWVNTVITFTCKPIFFTGADALDLAGLYYEVTNPDQIVDSDTTDKEILDLSGGYRQAIWTGDGTEYVLSSSTMLMTENVSLVLTLDTSNDLSYVRNTYDPQTIAVKFSNGCGWSEMFYIDYTCIVSSV